MEKELDSEMVDGMLELPFDVAKHLLLFIGLAIIEWSQHTS
eukprot:SAG11_NODE_28578_length_320_cov_0.696833_2_plen_41_part_00